MFTAGRSRRFALAAWMVVGLGLAGCRPDASELWAEHCARCHGDDGRGVEEQRTFYPNVDLTRSEMIVENARGPIYQRIAFGWGTMPGFEHKLRQSDLDRLVKFSIELGSAKPNGKD